MLMNILPQMYLWRRTSSLHFGTQPDRDCGHGAHSSGLLFYNCPIDVDRVLTFDIPRPVQLCDL